MADRGARAVRVALVGAGRRGRACAAALAEAGALCAVCDIDEDAARGCAREHSVGHYTALDEMMPSIPFDCAMVCTPAPSHRRVAEGLILAGKDVLFGEPATCRSADIGHLGRLAARHGVRLSYCRPQRSDRGLARVRQAAQSGDALTLRMSSSAGGAEEADLLGGMARGIDTALWLLGRQPEMVFARTDRARRDRVVLMMDFGVTPLVLVDVGPGAPPSQRIEVSCSGGALHSALTPPRGDGRSPPGDPPDGAALLRREIESVLGGAPSGHREAAAAARVAEAALLSEKCGSPIYLNEKEAAGDTGVPDRQARPAGAGRDKRQGRRSG